MAPELLTPEDYTIPFVLGCEELSSHLAGEEQSGVSPAALVGAKRSPEVIQHSKMHSGWHRSWPSFSLHPKPLHVLQLFASWL